MHISFFALADAANTTADGRINMLGWLENIITPVLPYFHPQITMVLKLKAEYRERIVPQSLTVNVLNDSNELRYTVSPVFALDDEVAKEARGVSVIFNLQWFEFLDYGDYTFQVALEGGTPVQTVLRVLPEPVSIPDPTVLFG